MAYRFLNGLDNKSLTAWLKGKQFALFTFYGEWSGWVDLGGLLHNGVRLPLYRRLPIELLTASSVK